MFLHIVIALAVTIITILVIIGGRPMKIPREPEREGLQVGKAVKAYDRTSSWPIFALERSIVLHELKKQPLRGILLDIGCGPGYLAARISRGFSGTSIIGLDINEEMIDIAINRWTFNNVVFLIGDAQRLPFPENSIDNIASSLSLHHWADARLAFREIFRVLKPGGWFLLFDLRRDGRRFFYCALKTGQPLLAPKAIRLTNGAVGSFWASYTMSELEEILSEIPFRECQVKGRFGWVLVTGRKPNN